MVFTILHHFELPFPSLSPFKLLTSVQSCSDSSGQCEGSLWGKGLRHPLVSQGWKSLPKYLGGQMHCRMQYGTSVLSISIVEAHSQFILIWNFVFNIVCQEDELKLWVTSSSGLTWDKVILGFPIPAGPFK